MAADSASLLERTGELAALGQALDTTLAGAGRLVVIEGEAGIGKSRLLATLRGLGGRGGCTVLFARGSELEQDITFGVIRQLFEAELAGADAAQRRRWLDGPAAGSTVAMTGPPPTGGTGDFSVLHALYWLTANLSQDATVLLAVDDIHWADAPSLRFLAYLAGRLSELPVLLAVTVRSGAADTEPLLGHLVTDPDRLHQTPLPLTPAAVATLVASRLGGDAATDALFSTACHAATGGNPLLLTELLSIAAAEGWQPTAANAERVLEVGARAVTRHVSLSLSRLSADATALARAVAVLGEDCWLEHAAVLASLSRPAAATAAGALHNAGLVDPTSGPGSTPPQLRYRHPLIRAAVYHGLPLDELMNGHARAADVLAADGGYDPEAVAAHLLPIGATGRPEHLDALLAAAERAQARGAADTALAHLRRCLAEPMSSALRVDLLVRAGTVALLVDVERATGYLQQALAVVDGAEQRGWISSGLGVAWLAMQNYDRARLVWDEALAALTETDGELGTTLRGQLLSLALVVPGDAGAAAHAGRLGHVGERGDVASRGVAGLLSCLNGYAGDRAGVALAAHAIETDVLVNHGRWQELACAWNCLVAADDPRVAQSLDAAVAAAHRNGATNLLIGALTYRLLWSVRRGELADAVTDGREGARLTDISNMRIARPHIGPWLALALLEQGGIDEATAAMAWVDRRQPTVGSARHYYQLTLAQLLAAQGHHIEALGAAMTAGDDFASHNGSNPAVLPWRSQAALSLHALGDHRDAQQHAVSELALATEWGAPTAVGRAHRIAGLVHSGPTSLSHLQTAVTVLTGSHGRLELAKAQVDLGAALRRAGQRSAALRQLRDGAALAQRCGAGPVLRLAHAEIRTAGAKPRRDRTGGGSAALTESEHRVATLAAQGHANKFIAQQLYITTKTVEVHLGNVYRKLGTTRRELTPERLGRSTADTARSAVRDRRATG
jgi:DNA-binding CsgD family transcriptional regulator